MYVLGISCYYHDSAASLICDGEILCAAEEERFTRIKHDSAFPENAIGFCLDFANIKLEEVDSIVYYEKPLLKFDRILETFFTEAPKGLYTFVTFLPVWIKEKIFLKTNLKKSLKKFATKIPDIYYSQHHLSHAASAFYTSPFSNSAVLCIDGVGEWATTSSWLGAGAQLIPIEEIHYPHSLGLLYSTFTSYLGFKVNSGEYKIMGLAPYGKPKYRQVILDHLILLLEDGSFQLNLSYFNFLSTKVMYNNNFIKLFQHPPRENESELTQFHKDIAASIQSVLEEAIIKLATSLKLKTNEENLCLAGGVALNCVANSTLKNTKLFKNIWIQPAAGDSGGAIGAALAFYFYKINKRIISENIQKGSNLGPSFSNSQIEETLTQNHISFEFIDDTEILNEHIAREIGLGKIIGYFQGQMEFGPRALGSRSIIADPRIANMKEVLNEKIKLRESFRPFAPIVLREKVNDYFDWSSDINNSYMLFTAQVYSNVNLPSITHVDLSARLQIVDKNIHSKLYALLDSFYKLTNCPVLINTSFNVRGEPIVCTPQDALSCFMTTDIDILILENFIIYKDNQSDSIRENWISAYAID